MKTSGSSRYASLCCILFSLFQAIASAQIAPHVVISEVYGGGGNSGSVYKNDYIELYNPTNFSVSLAGWSVQYTSGGGSTWSITPLSGSIAARSYYLVQEAQGSGGTTNLPTPDAIGTIGLASTAGKIALVNSTSALADTNPSSDPSVVDFVGWGSSANGFEGFGAAPATGNTVSIERKAQSTSTPASLGTGGADESSGNGWDGNSNNSDFATRASQEPQNSASASETPPAVGNVPPVIGTSTRSPFVAELAGADTVTALITDNDGALTGTYLHYRVNGGTYDSSAMTAIGGSQFRGIIPPSKHAAAGDLIEYFISASDDSSGYTTTIASLEGYFTATSPIGSVKIQSPSSIEGYGARIQGTVNVRTNTFANGLGYVQDGTGGMQLFQSGGLPPFDLGKNMRVQGTLAVANGGCRLTAPSFAFVDTNLGTTVLTPTTVTLPLTQSSSNVSEGRLVKIIGLSTDSSGLFGAPKRYLYRTGGSDTITVAVQSNGVANTLSGAPIATMPVDASGILCFMNDFLELRPRRAEDMGTTPAITFEAIASGSWKNPSIWSGGVVPTSGSNVTMTTQNVIVTIDSAAACNHLSMVGVDTTGGQLGPELRFASTGAISLTVNGRLELSGGTAAGNGSHGGKPKLTSNGNPLAVLVAKSYVFTDVTNTVSNGDGGLNMNEGTVRFIGSTLDTLRTGAGLRLAHLVIGDGTQSKTLLWRMSSSATMNVRSITVKSGSTFLLGSTTASSTNSIGNATNAGLPLLDGGISIESGASMLANDASGGHNIGRINVSGGGITNNGTLTLTSSDSSREYYIEFGGFSQDTLESAHEIAGTGETRLANATVGTGDTLLLHKGVIADTVEIRGRLIETPGNVITGIVTATRKVAQGIAEDFGGLGVRINAKDAAPGVTQAVRTTGSPQTGGGYGSIKRFIDIFPALNSGLNATLDFSYDETELNGNNDEASLKLWKSTDGGSNWSPFPTTANPTLNMISASGIGSFSRWTAADGFHPLGGGTVQYAYNAKWNMISLPLEVSDPRADIVFPNALSDAFTFSSAYIARDTLQHGVGYWVKFGSPETVSIFGSVIGADTIPVVAGWNMIGSISAPVPTSSIVEDPPNLVASQYYGYGNAYTAETIIAPGKGYWVKANGSGNLILGSSSRQQKPLQTSVGLDALNRLTITDASGAERQLYFGNRIDASQLSQFELPPPPPAGAFDVRFSSERSVEIVRGRDHTIILQTASYPVTLEWDLQPGTVGYGLEITSMDGKDLRRLTDRGSITLTSQSDVKLCGAIETEVPSHYSVSPGYPNPFNPSSAITIGLPHDALLDVVVHDVVGRVVKTLVHEHRNAGMHRVEWNGLTDDGQVCASGVYYVRVSSRDFLSTQKIVLAK